ncbi:MAG: hypothetical protein NVSMB62_12620 [Acidobacteriaceae bacterium]
MSELFDHIGRTDQERTYTESRVLLETAQAASGWRVPDCSPDLFLHDFTYAWVRFNDEEMVRGLAQQAMAKTLGKLLQGVAAGLGEVDDAIDQIIKIVSGWQ